MSGPRGGDGRVPPPTRLPAFIAAPLSRLYRVGINHRNSGFDRGRGVTTLDRPVVSIGNLSTGGTGKTPMVHWVARRLMAMGHAPAIAMRGYKAGPGQSSDEQLEHLAALPEAPVVAQPDRIAALRRLFATDRGRPVDCVILDDGFQHRRIARDLDIVLVDATAPPQRDALLPLGNLREPLDSLARAGAIVITHCERVSAPEADRLADDLACWGPRGCPIVTAEHVWEGLVEHTLGPANAWSSRSVTPGSVSGRSAAALCAIGNPAPYFAAIEQAGVRLVHRQPLPDHDPIKRETLARVLRAARTAGAERLWMTQKDWVKAQRVWDPSFALPVVVPRLGLRLDGDGSKLVPLLEGLFARGARAP